MFSSGVMAVSEKNSDCVSIFWVLRRCGWFVHRHQVTALCFGIEEDFDPLSLKLTFDLCDLRFQSCFCDPVIGSLSKDERLNHAPKRGSA